MTLNFRNYIYSVSILCRRIQSLVANYTIFKNVKMVFQTLLPSHLTLYLAKLSQNVRHLIKHTHTANNCYLLLMQMKRFFKKDKHNQAFSAFIR